MSATSVNRLILLTLAWGVLAFGAVYPWAYWPLAVLCVASGAAGWRGAAGAAGPTRWLLLPVALVTIAIACQLVPISAAALRDWSPATVEFLRAHDLGFALAERAHPLSIAPAATARALVLFLCLSIFTAGVARWVSAQGVRGLAAGVAALGLAVAVIGIVQRPLYAGKIYGFWTPVFPGNVFGPFVNKNHFAGWMMMCLPVALASFFDSFGASLEGVKPTWRDRLAWLGSRSVTRLVVQFIAVIVMSLSLVLTLSRSGITAFVAAMSLTFLFVVFSTGRLWRKIVITLFLIALVAGAIQLVGTDVLADRFIRPSTQNYNDRRGAWDDAQAVAEAFPWGGTGINTYGVAMVLYQRHDLSLHYDQAHNDYLQLRAEGGWLVTVPAFLLALFLTGAIVSRFRQTGSQASRAVRAGAVTGIMAIGLQEIFDFSLQMPGNAAMFAVLVALALHRAPHSRRPRPHGEARA